MTTNHLVLRTQAARVLRAGANSTLHGVVFAILSRGAGADEAWGVSDQQQPPLRPGRPAPNPGVPRARTARGLTPHAADGGADIHLGSLYGGSGRGTGRRNRPG